MGTAVTTPTLQASGEARARSLGARPPLHGSGKSLLTNGRVQTLLKRLIEGDDLKTAAATAKITTVRARMLLHDPAVRRAYFRGMEVLRDSERARNIHLAVSIRDAGMDAAANAAAKKVALEAARYLDGESPHGGAGASVNVTVNTVVGYVMDLREDGEVIANHRADAAKPLIQHAPVGRDDE